MLNSAAELVEVTGGNWATSLGCAIPSLSTHTPPWSPSAASAEGPPMQQHSELSVWANLYFLCSVLNSVKPPFPFFFFPNSHHVPSWSGSGHSQVGGHSLAGAGLLPCLQPCPAPAALDYQEICKPEPWIVGPLQRKHFWHTHTLFMQLELKSGFISLSGSSRVNHHIPGKHRACASTAQQWALVTGMCTHSSERSFTHSVF